MGGQSCSITQMISGRSMQRIWTLVISICPSFHEAVLAYLGCQLKITNKTQGQTQLMSTIPRATSDGRQVKLS